jgi:hypothetical protein
MQHDLALSEPFGLRITLWVDDAIYVDVSVRSMHALSRIFGIVGQIGLELRQVHPVAQRLCRQLPRTHITVYLRIIVSERSMITHCKEFRMFL